MMRKYEHQRTDTDCSICCTAMALSLDYDVIRDFVGHGGGWNGETFDAVFEHFGYDIIAQPRMFYPRRPAIFSVPSRLNEGRFHAVYYRDGVVFDPTAKTTPYKITSVLQTFLTVYQWEKIDTVDRDQIHGVSTKQGV